MGKAAGLGAAARGRTVMVRGEVAEVGRPRYGVQRSQTRDPKPCLVWPSLCLKQQEPHKDCGASLAMEHTLHAPQSPRLLLSTHPLLHHLATHWAHEDI